MSDKPASTRSSVVIEQPLRSCAVRRVTVYSDRAQVERTVKITPQQCGVHDVLLMGLPPATDSDSIRVKGAGRACEVLDVVYDVHSRTKPYDAPDTSVLHARLTSLNKEERALNQRIERIKRQQDLTQQYIHASAHARSDPAVASGSASCISVEAMRELVRFHSEHRLQQDHESIQLNSQRSKLRLSIQQIEAEIELQRLHPHGETIVNCHDVTVSVDVIISGAEMELEISYVTRGASWKPAYDIKSSSSTDVLTLVYYGVVQQSTGEDWIDASLALSTATPALQGQPDPLQSKIVRIKTPPIYHAISRKKRSVQRQNEARIDCELLMDDDLMPPMASMSAPPLPPPAAAVVTAKATSSQASGSSTFEIPRPTTVFSDNKEHKVTIAQLELQATIVNYTVPSASAHAYLQAKTRNTSEFPFLASEKVSVFMDGSFITRTRLRNISPGEAFSTFLGVNPNVRVEYRSTRTNDKIVGWVSKTKTAAFTINTIITNKSAHVLCVGVLETIPRSYTDKVKVDLQMPSPDQLVTLAYLEVTKENQNLLSDPELMDLMLERQFTSVGPVRDESVLNPASSSVISIKFIAGALCETAMSLVCNSYSVTWPEDSELVLADA